MSGAQTLRALVNERLAAAAEDIFVLIERTIAEYEEELSRSKQENQRKQQLLDKVLSPRVQLVRANVQIPTSPGPGLNHKITETLQIKEEPEEQSVTQEEEQLPVSVPESRSVCVKTEESSLLQQRQTEHREETQGEDSSSEPHFHSDSDTDNDDDWEQPSFPTAKSTGLFPKYKSAPETSVHSGDKAGADGGAERKKHQCSGKVLVASDPPPLRYDGSCSGQSQTREPQGSQSQPEEARAKGVDQSQLAVEESQSSCLLGVGELELQRRRTQEEEDLLVALKLQRQLDRQQKMTDRRKGSADAYQLRPAPRGQAPPTATPTRRRAAAYSTATLNRASSEPEPLWPKASAPVALTTPTTHKRRTKSRLTCSTSNKHGHLDFSL